MARVRTGLSDGQHTVVMSRDIKEGTQLIVGASVATASTASTTSSTNPLQPQTQRGGGRGGPGGF
jgi:hypothetical protein